MSKLIILSGISNSGKSTKSKELFNANPERVVIVGRDKLREALYGYTEETVKDYYLREDFNFLENQITAVQDNLINFWLRKGKTVIIDNTNLRKSYIEDFNKFKFPVELIFFDVTLKEALTRNMGRKRQVDPEIIDKQYSQYVNLRKEYDRI